jgi:ferredoxin--NADP+ reductase
METNNLNATLVKLTELAPGLSIMRLKPDGWALPDFEAGQYATIGLPGKAGRSKLSDPEETAPDPEKIIKRAYSICSSSKEKEYLELFITHIRSGSLTPRLFNLKKGDKLFLGEKFKGLFTLKDVPPEANIVMVGTGTGLAPYMSMIRTEFEESSTRRFAVLHGARHSWDLGYRAELETLAYYFKRFAYLPTISRPQEENEGWSGHAGYVQDIWKKNVVRDKWGVEPKPENTHFFLCGAPNMVEEMSKILSEAGFREHKKKEPGQVHVERFW